MTVAIFDPGWPTCAVCNRPVQRLSRDEDPVRRKLTVVAECHGDVESVDIAEADLVTNAERIKFGRAFVGAPRALPPVQQTPAVPSSTVGR